MPDLMALDTTGGEFVKRGASGSGITRNGCDARTTMAFATTGVAAAAISGGVAKPVLRIGPSGAVATGAGFELPGSTVTTGICVATGVGFALPGSAVTTGTCVATGAATSAGSPSATLAANWAAISCSRARWLDGVSGGSISRHLQPSSSVRGVRLLDLTSTDSALLFLLSKSGL